MSNVKKNKLIDSGFKIVGLLTTVFAIGVLALFIGDIFWSGISRIDWKFLTNAPSTLSAERAGIYPALGGTLWVFGLTCLMAIPLGISAGVYLQEYGKKGRLATIIELNITNLAGIPSVIYGLLGLALFRGLLNFENANVVIAGAFTLSLLVLPVIIVSTREA
jgi:phosphate transport system permease protein